MLLKLDLFKIDFEFFIHYNYFFSQCIIIRMAKISLAILHQVQLMKRQTRKIYGEKNCLETSAWKSIFFYFRAVSYYTRSLPCPRKMNVITPLCLLSFKPPFCLSPSFLFVVRPLFSLLTSGCESIISIFRRLLRQSQLVKDEESSRNFVLNTL